MEPAELIGLIRTFISHAKSNCLTIPAIRQRLDSMPSQANQDQVVFRRTCEQMPQLMPDVFDRRHSCGVGRSARCGQQDDAETRLLQDFPERYHIAFRKFQILQLCMVI